MDTGGYWAPNDMIGTNPVPLTGDTLNFGDNPSDQMMYVEPAGTLAALTINLPADANSRVGQVCVVVMRRAITAWTIGQIGGGATILAGPTAALLNSTHIFYKVKANTWSYK